MSDSSRFINQRVAAMRHQQRLELAMRARQAQSQQFARANYEPPPNYSMVGQADGIGSAVASLLGIAPLAGSSAGTAATAGSIINGVAWLPTSVASCRLWLRPANLVDDGSGKASSWLDACTSDGSQDFAQATSTKRPTITTYGGKNASDSVPANVTAMTCASAVSSVVTASNYTIAARFKMDAVTGVGASFYTNEGFWGDSGGYVGVHVRDIGGGQIQAGGYHYDTSARFAVRTVNTTDYVYLTFVCNSNVLSIWVNGSSASPTVSQPSSGLGSTSGTMWLFDPAFGPVMDGLGMEIAVYNTALTGTDLTNLQTYLAAQ